MADLIGSLELRTGLPASRPMRSSKGRVARALSAALNELEAVAEDIALRNCDLNVIHVAE